MSNVKNQQSSFGRGWASEAYDKPIQAKGAILRRLWHYLSCYRWGLALALGLMLLANSLSLFGPKLSGYAIDAIGSKPGQVDFPNVFYYAGMMISFYLVAAVTNYILAAVMVHISRKIVYQMRRDVYQHLMRLPVSFFDRHLTGDILSVISYDIDVINASLSNDFVQILASIITVLGSLLMMLSISPQLILVFVVTVPISIIFTRRRSRLVRPKYRKRSHKLGKLNGFAEEITGGLKTIKAYHREEYFIQEFDKLNREACEANYEADWHSSSTGPAVGFINNLSLALVSMFGAILYMQGRISLGNVSSFVLYSRKFSGPINELANIMAELQSALAAAERLFRLLDEPMETPDREDAEELKEIKGEIKLQSVAFGYDEKPVLKEVDMTARPGETIAIVGETGSGKTTIINLLMRFYDIDSGSITIDGKEICHVSRSSLRKAFSMVLQDTWLFSGTIFENLAYGREGVTLEEVKAVAKAAKINTFIESLPQGYDTMIKDSGSNISKGQKQLLTIARAMLLDAPMLILDEATSNVDTQTERQIQAAMLHLMKTRTCIVIAHRLSTIVGADQIIVLKDGRVVDSGTHQELLNKGGYYQELYQAQFDNQA
ncbi:ABC transporter ATP-binding protein [Clostridiales bacterium COT073_COT-073]|nr:ABC transporter ATP-binding protein [Clostridiales bacterium COT073_COT-073]